jgi:DNA-binding transcriptional regulator YiaG
VVVGAGTRSSRRTSWTRTESWAIMEVPPRVACLDTRHARRPFASGQVDSQPYAAIMTQPSASSLAEKSMARMSPAARDLISQLYVPVDVRSQGVVAQLSRHRRRRHYARVLHGSATTTARIRTEFQSSEESVAVLARRHGANVKTVAKWRDHRGVENLPVGSRERESTILTPLEQAAIVAFRVRTRLTLDDVFSSALKPSIQSLTRDPHRRRLPRGVGQGGALPHPYRTDRQWHAVLRLGQAAPPRSGAPLRPGLSQARHRAPAQPRQAPHKVLRWKTPYETIRALWESEPELFY